ncbi:MAG TPA: hypothetical protein VF059_04280 [Casimicrobiaceae bacterium]
MARAADPLALPRVPAPALPRHRRRDALATVLFVGAIAAMGVAAFRPRAETTLDAENRRLAPWPQPRLARTFAAEFERAFADRFGGRDALLRLHNRMLVRAFGVSPSPNVLLGRDGWLYFLGEDATAFDRYFRGTLPVTDAEIRAVVAELVRRERFLAAHGIAYVVTLAPDKYTIYPEHLPAWARHASGPTPLDRLAAALGAEGTLRYVDLRAPLRAAKASERVYYASDSHWNSLGAAVAYREIMRAVAAALAPRAVSATPVVQPPYVPGVDIYHGDLARMTGDPARFGEPDHAPQWKILAASQSRCARRIDAGSDAGLEWYACDRPGLPRAVVYRDSMGIPLVPLLSENFSRVAYVSSRRLDPAFVLREHPDVVVEELVERSMLAPAALPMPDPVR